MYLHMGVSVVYVQHLQCNSFQQKTRYEVNICTTACLFWVQCVFCVSLAPGIQMWVCFFLRRRA